MRSWSHRGADLDAELVSNAELISTELSLKRGSDLDVELVSNVELILTRS
jgi:hypothetical protein